VVPDKHSPVANGTNGLNKRLGITYRLNVCGRALADTNAVRRESETGRTKYMGDGSGKGVD